MHIFYAVRHFYTKKIIQNFNLRTCKNFIDLGLFRSASDLDDLKTVLVCSFLLQVLIQYFETVPSFYTYFKKLYLKAIGFSNYKGYFIGQ